MRWFRNSLFVVIGSCFLVTHQLALLVAADEIDDAIRDLDELRHKFDDVPDDFLARVDALGSSLAGGHKAAMQALHNGLRNKLDRQTTVNALFALNEREELEQSQQIIIGLIWAAWMWHPDQALRRKLTEATKMMANPTEWRQAMTIMNSVIKSDSLWSEAWNHRATLKYLMEDYEGSLADTDVVLSMEARHFEAINRRSMVMAMVTRAANVEPFEDDAQEDLDGRTADL